jgi:hypothetical protein
MSRFALDSLAGEEALRLGTRSILRVRAEVDLFVNEGMVHAP